MLHLKTYLYFLKLELSQNYQQLFFQLIVLNCVDYSIVRTFVIPTLFRRKTRENPGNPRKSQVNTFFFTGKVRKKGNLWCFLGKPRNPQKALKQLF